MYFNGFESSAVCSLKRLEKKGSAVTKWLKRDQLELLTTFSRRFININLKLELYMKIW